MKKSAFKKLTVFSVLAAAFCVIISSCSNFMDGSDVKSDLDKKIRIANSVCPQAKVEEPVFQDAGVAKNKRIIISFTKSMNIQTFWENLSITDSLGNNLKPNFLEPIWSNENKLVEIPANELNFIDLRGKKYLDVYVTLTKSCEDKDGLPIEKAIDHKYRIIEEIDNIPPVLAYTKGEVPPAYLSKSEDELTTELFCGEYTYQTEAQICSTNHINSKIDFYVEGSDYGGGNVWAHFLIQRVYDTDGKTLNEDARTQAYKLNQINYDGNYFDTVCVDLSDPQFYLDGMYKITASVSDSSDVSEKNNVYYVIRDTSLANSASALIWFETPGFRQDEEEGALLDPFDKIVATKDKIDYFQNRIQLGFILDDVYYISRFGNKAKYQQNHNDFTYYFSWGTSLDKLEPKTPVKITGTTQTELHNNSVSTLTGDEAAVYYYLPEAYKEYCKTHKKSDIYLQATVMDSVGNKNTVTTLIPKEVDFYNYEVSENAETKDKTIKLNYSDMSLENATDISTMVSTPDKYIEVLYRIYYAPIPDGVTKAGYSSIELQRNLKLTYKQELAIQKRFNVKDKAELVIPNVGTVAEPKYHKYLIYIQANYGFHSKVNNIWTGQTFGPCYELVVDLNEAAGENTLDVPTITLDKEEDGTTVKVTSAGAGTGLYNITGKITNYDSALTYIPCVSTDGGTNWIYYDVLDKSRDFSFSIMNPLKAPFETWKNDSDWKDDYYIAWENRSFAATVKVKILAIKDNVTKESTPVDITFNSAKHDNIAPSQVPRIVSHDSLLSFDGHSYKYGGAEGLIKEDEGHLDKNFTYYYTPYNDAWGSNLSIMSDEEILALPNGTGTYETGAWIDEDENQVLIEAAYRVKPVVPVNGLSDGKYMFFAKVYDTKGNSSILTLGKADINTFKNKLNVTYNLTGNSLKASLIRESNEAFDRNMLNIQRFDSEWQNHYGYKKELSVCNSTPENGKTVLHYTATELTKGKFYRLTMQGFNEHPFDEATKTGVRLKYQEPYNEGQPYDIMSNYDYFAEEREYDIYTEETVSNTVYYYVPGEGEDISNVKNSFFKNTAAFSSSHKVLVNVISSLTDLGGNIDEWERRGKLIMSKVYDVAEQKTFNDRTAIDAMADSKEYGFRYYVVVVHFANNTSAISNVYTMEGM